MATYEQVGMPLRQMREYLRKHWGWFLTVGILLTALGILAIGYMVAATIVSVLAFGIILAAVGIFQIVEAFNTRKWEGVLLHVIVGILYLITGVILFIYPGMSAILLTIMLTGFFILVGVFRMIASIIMRFNQWGWTFFSGLITIAAGILLYLTLPFSGVWIIGFFVGVDLLFYGISILAFAIAVKRREPVEI